MAFASLPEFDAIKWVAKKNEPIYSTNYTDILRVAFTYKFKRGRFTHREDKDELRIADLNSVQNYAA